MAGALLYDPDCGFCSACAHRMGRWGLRCEILPMSDEHLAEAGIDPERAAREIPWVAADGSVCFGARAFAASLRTGGPLAHTLGGLLARWPVLPLADRCYRLVARNRHRLPGGNASCRLQDRPWEGSPPHRK